MISGLMSMPTPSHTRIRPPAQMPRLLRTLLLPPRLPDLPTYRPHPHKPSSWPGASVACNVARRGGDIPVHWEPLRGGFGGFSMYPVAPRVRGAVQHTPASCFAPTLTRHMFPTIPWSHRHMPSAPCNRPQKSLKLATDELLERYLRFLAILLPRLHRQNRTSIELACIHQSRR